MPAERTATHTVPVAAARRRRLRADQARQLADLLRDGYARTAVAALADPAWQVRAGAAAGLSAATPETAVPALAKALADANADVRKAAVLSLLAHRDATEARAALATAVSDPDADVRAYAARAA
ncbi:HEAT repeat domain-containing protein [Streptomyces sp. NPDC001549]|uniref:HEAT repeat domain-containing protein n=1 Tax=Streptomyces sp. NPDC001549 TaxID=3364586 RepID=UPI00367CC896